jgi:hypothetical protein
MYDVRQVDVTAVRKNGTNQTSGLPRNFIRGGGQQIQLRTEDRQNEDLGVVAP